MSTNNRWQTLVVKSDARKMRLTIRHGVSDQIGNEVRDSAAQQLVGRGRPRSEDKGQVVSCRLPAEELRAFDALCTQLGARSGCVSRVVEILLSRPPSGLICA